VAETGQFDVVGHDGQDNLNGQGGSPDTLVGSNAFDVLDDNAVDGMVEFLADWIDVT
jgi:hypothetical protein